MVCSDELMEENGRTCVCVRACVSIPQQHRLRLLVHPRLLQVLQSGIRVAPPQVLQLVDLGG